MKLNFKPTVLVLGTSLLAFTAMADDSTTTPGSSQNQDSTINPSTASLSSQQFVTDAATTDMKEIRLGELAQQKSENSDVQSFAKHLVADHQKACKKLKAIAEKEGLTFPDTNSMAVNDFTENQDNNNTGQPAVNGYTNTYTVGDIQNAGHPIANSTNITGNTDTANNNSEGQANGQSGINRHELNLATLSGPDFDRAYVAKMVKGHEKAIREFETASAVLTDVDLKKYADKTLPTLKEHLHMAQELQAKVGIPSDMSTALNSVK